MIITHEREKLADAIIYFVKNTKYCGLIKLFKLLYFLDFVHYRETGKSVTGLEYYAWQRGPAPREFWSEIKSGLKDELSKAVLFQQPDPAESEKRLTTIKVLRSFDGKHLTKREKKIMETLAYVFLEARADDMVEVTHLKDHPWDTTIKKKGRDAKIDYDLALDGSAGQLDLEELALRRQEREEARKALGDIG